MQPRPVVIALLIADLGLMWGILLSGNRGITPDLYITAMLLSVILGIALLLISLRVVSLFARTMKQTRRRVTRAEPPARTE